MKAAIATLSFLSAATLSDVAHCDVSQALLDLSDVGVMAHDARQVVIHIPRAGKYTFVVRGDAPDSTKETGFLQCAVSDVGYTYLGGEDNAISNFCAFFVSFTSQKDILFGFNNRFSEGHMYTVQIIRSRGN